MKKNMLVKFSICVITAFTFFNLNIAQAGTDDARVLGGIDWNTDIFTYLNTYPFSLWKSNHMYAPSSYNDLYLSKDRCVAVDLWNDRLGQIFILAPGYKTDKDIEVGMTVNDIEYAYGPVYDSKDEPQNDTAAYGVYHDNNNNPHYRKYGFIEYVSPRNEGINFVIDKKTKRIVLIMYQMNRHGNGSVMSYVQFYKLLPDENE